MTRSKEDLRKIAFNQAKQILQLTDEPGTKIEQRSGTTEWNEGVYKNVAEFNLRAWRCTALIDIEMDPDNGEVLSYKNILSGADGN